MADLKNTRFHINAFDIIVALIFASVLVVSAVFLKKFEKTNDLYNIAKTDVDFVIMAPTREQVEEMRGLSHVNSVVPYVYRTSDISINKKSISANVVIIEKEDDLPKTVFSDKLRIKTSNSDVHNPIYVSDEFSDLTGVKTGDSLQIPINGTPIDFSIKGIYRGDHRTIGGIVMAVMNDDLLTALGGQYGYNGAYVDSNDISQTRTFFEGFIPEGDLRTREDFDSDEAYQIYINDRKSVKNSEYLTDIEVFLKNVSKKNDAERLRNCVIAIVLVVIDIALIALIPLIRSLSYIKNNVGRDVRNGFKIKQELSMFSRFFVCEAFLLIAGCAIALLVTFVIFRINSILIVFGIALVLAIILLISISSTSKNKLNKEFARQVEILDREKRIAAK